MTGETRWAGSKTCYKQHETSTAQRRIFMSKKSQLASRADLHNGGTGLDKKGKAWRPRKV